MTTSPAHPHAAALHACTYCGRHPSTHGSRGDDACPMCGLGDVDTLAPDHAAVAATTLRRLAAEATAADLPTHAARLDESRREAVRALESLAVHGGEDIAGHAAGMAYTLDTCADACPPGLLETWAREVESAD